MINRSDESPAQGDEQGKCPACAGTGKLQGVPCPRCDGTGRLVEGLGQ